MTNRNVRSRRGRRRSYAGEPSLIGVEDREVKENFVSRGFNLVKVQIVLGNHRILVGTVPRFTKPVDRRRSEESINCVRIVTLLVSQPPEIREKTGNSGLSLCF